MKKLKHFVRYFIKEILRVTLKVFYIFPICPSRILLFNMISWQNKNSWRYGDNPKYINEYIKRQEKGKYQVIFPLYDPKENDGSFICVKPFSWSFFYYCLTSSVVITNSTTCSFVPFRRRQLVINTWHGGGAYKKIFIDAPHNQWAEKLKKMFSASVNYMPSSCRAFIETAARDMGISYEKCLPYGTPKADIFFEECFDIKDKVRSYYNIHENTRIVLYAPTYRKDASGYYDDLKGVFIRGETYGIDYRRMIQAFAQRFGGTWCCLVRLHPSLAHKSLKMEKDIFGAGEYPDMQELLYTADALVSDYSSSIWDYSFTFRPCLLYVPDLEHYKRERDCYTPILQWPFSLARSNDELEKKILGFDEEDYVKRVKKHHEDLGSYETGHACEKIFKLIDKHVESFRS